MGTKVIEHWDYSLAHPQGIKVGETTVETVPAALSATGFMEHCWANLGGGETGRARFGKIVRAMKGSADDGVLSISERYEAARNGGTFSKANVQAFLAVLQSKGIPDGAVITDAEESAILNAWPEAALT